MASRAALAADIRKQYGNLLNLSQVARYMGKSRDFAAQFMADVDCYRTGKERCYLATDLAAKLDFCKEVPAQK